MEHGVGFPNATFCSTTPPWRKNMNRINRTVGAISLTCLLLGIPAYLLADRAHDLASQATGQQAANCDPGSLDSTTCHTQFPTGCSDAARPTYDAYLNFLKNQTPGPDVPSTALLTGDDFLSLEGQLPSGLKSRNHARFASFLADLNEGNIVTVIGYLYFAEDTGKGSSGRAAFGETCNCKLQLPGSFDYHIGLGFDAALAQQIQATKPQPDAHNPGDMEQTSVVAEMTPHTRHSNWTFDRVNSLQGKQVKVVGQLMVDNVHFNPRDDCNFTNSGQNCWRATVWEVHPVTQFYVCNLDAGCNQSSPDSSWTSLDDLP